MWVKSRRIEMQKSSFVFSVIHSKCMRIEILIGVASAEIEELEWCLSKDATSHDMHVILDGYC